MADIIGFENKEEKVHRLTNTLDGSLALQIYVDDAKGDTVVYVNGSEACRAEAGDGGKPFYCGSISIPRGEFTLSVESQSEIEKILLAENLHIESSEDFELCFMNRKREWVFERDRVEYTPEMLETLHRHGFLFDQPDDTAAGTAPSGVPLGGMGCGKLEICSDGMFTAFTGNNNQDCPIYRMPGSFLALACGNKVRIIRKDPLGLPYQPMEKVEADLEFPFAKLVCTDVELPVLAEVNAFSAHIPGNASDSALPCVFFEVKLQNQTSKEAEASFCFSWENLINVGGSMVVTNKSERVFPLCYHTWNCSYPWSDRRTNYCVKNENALVFAARDDCKNPMSFGRHVLYCSEADAEYICDRSILPEDEQKFMEMLAGKGKMAKNCESASEFRAGAYVVRRRLREKETAVMRFILAWYMPTLVDEEGFDHGVEYTNRFGNAEEVLAYVLENWGRLYAETKNFNDIVKRSTLPKWFQRRILDDRFVVNTNSWYDRAENFSINEAPTGMGGCLGTLDQRTASQSYYTTFFPELDERELDLFRRSQARDGMCAHEIGFAAIKLWARPFSKWPDLADSYVIQVYHHYQRTGDMEFLRLHWPHMKKAIAWTLTLDDIKCGIPFICPGRGTTYDNQFWEGVNAFISTMQIAAYRIGAVCARIVGETETALEWDELRKRAETYRREHLWDKENKYFWNAYNPVTGEIDTSCFIAALAGEWAAIRAGLTTDLSIKQIGEIAGVITSQCVGDRGITDQGGRRETTEGFLQYPMAYLAAPALYAGNAAAAWRLAAVTDQVMQQEYSNHFDQALTYSFTGKRHGLPYYMTAPASWNMLEALAGLVADVSTGCLSLAPVETKNVRIPVFLTGAWFEILCSEDGQEMQLLPVKSERACRFHTLRVAGDWCMDGVKGTYEDGVTVFTMPYVPGEQILVLKRNNNNAFSS